MNVKLFVGNLPKSITQEELSTLFAQAGEVTLAEIITDRGTGASRGFAFVTLGTQSEAEKAIEVLNGTEQYGRTLTVNMSRPREDRSRSGGGNRNRW